MSDADERTAELQYEAGMYQSLYENSVKQREAMLAALLDIRRIANGAGNQRTIINRIYEIATLASRGEYIIASVSSQKDPS